MITLDTLEKQAFRPIKELLQKCPPPIIILLKANIIINSESYHHVTHIIIEENKGNGDEVLLVIVMTVMMIMMMEMMMVSKRNKNTERMDKLKIKYGDVKKLKTYYEIFCPTTNVSDVQGYISKIDTESKMLSHWEFHSETIEMARKVYGFAQSQTFVNIFNKHLTEIAEMLTVEDITKTTLTKALKDFAQLSKQYEGQDWEKLKCINAASLWKDVTNVELELKLMENYVALDKNQKNFENLVKTLKQLASIPNWVVHLEQLLTIIEIFNVPYEKDHWLIKSRRILQDDILTLGKLNNFFDYLNGNLAEIDNDTFWPFVEELSDFFEFINIAEHDINNLINGVDGFNDERLNQEDTVASLVEVQQLRLQLTKKAKKEDINIKKFLDCLVSINTDNPTLISKISLCNMYKNTSNRVTKEKIQNAVEKGTYSFECSSKDEKFTVALTYPSNLNEIKPYFLTDLQNLRGRALLIAKPTSAVNIRMDANDEEQIEKVRIMDEFVRQVDLVHEICNIGVKLIQIGHSGYRQYKKSVSDGNKINELTEFLKLLKKDFKQWENNEKFSALKGQFIKEFDYNTFENITRVASGEFVPVYRANSPNLGKHVALKSFRDNDEFYENFPREYTNITAINNHDNVINFYGISKDPSTETYYLVLQYAKDGDLRFYLRNNFTSFDWKIKLNMAKDLARGLKFIHQANIVHRDLHSKNVLVHEGRLLISDFASSKSLVSDSNSIIDGMFAYTDPEYIRNPINYKRNKASDIYSLGVLLWELSSGRPPFNNTTIFEMYKMITSGLRETPIQGTPLDYVNIYSCAWNHDPDQRPTIENIYNSLENINISGNIENSEIFSKDSVSSCSSYSSSSGIIDINNTYDQATFVEKSADIIISPILSNFANCEIDDIDNPYNRASSPTIEDHGETSHCFNDRKWFNDIIKNNGIIIYDCDVFENLEYIGRGAFGRVYSATLMDEKMTKMKVALKSIIVDSIKLFVNELKQHSEVGSHENIIEFYGVSQKDLNRDEYMLVLEYANGGTLRSYLASNFKNLEWSDKLNFAQQIARAIKHLHSREVIHRDLHSKNILIHNNIIKISDFGLAKLISDPSITLLKMAGSIAYSDPMLFIKGEKFNRTKASDIYSFGILLWEISSGEIPYKQYPGPSKMFYIAKGNRETPVKGTPRDYINIYQECWEQEPNKRPNIDKVIQVLDTLTDIYLINQISIP
ncbi:hypothetical protein Glove_157g11 [Diversispora epigaea]|uniref:Protein kinase domain-containing protein n=1 Tax=Diversispora epigaea TaxID=1348612 RepID=A0A397J0B3_9GLOM|nr:hypothetical protein Glove_157g11 [Diversispora epigaea]